MLMERIQWVVLVLYGIVGALFSYCVSLAVTSPLAAFALSAGYQVIMFVVCSWPYRAYSLPFKRFYAVVPRGVPAHAYLRQDV